MSEKRGALAGPESAAEHVRNALQLLELPHLTMLSYWRENLEQVRAARARLVAALAILEAK